MTTGRIAAITEYGKPFELREYNVPDPEPGAAVIRVEQAGICGSDLHTWRGDMAANPLPPQGRAMGHEGSGRIWKLGTGVTTDALGAPLREGDRVIHSAIFPCGRCYICLRGEVNYCPNNQVYRDLATFPHFTGTYADYFYTPPGHPIFRVPDELPDAVLSPVNCAMGTVTQGLLVAAAGEDQYVVIQGAGGLGLTAAAMAKDMGAGLVIVLDRLPRRLELARQFGADETIDVTEYGTSESRVERVRQLTRGRMADIIMELVGLSDLLPEAIAMIRNGGTVLEIGNIVRGSTVAIEPSQLLRGKRIIGSAMYRPSTLSLVLSFLVKTRDKYPFASLISHRFPLNEINDAFSEAEWSDRLTDVTRAVLVP